MEVRENPAARPVYRVTRPGDEARLLEIWREAYGGDTDCAEIYFRQLYRPGDGVVTEAEGTLCSAIYLIDGYQLHIPGERSRACTYLYALGTPEAFRGKGYGGRTIWKSGVVGYERGADFVCFLPASPGLYRWYEGCIGTRTVFYRRTFTVSAAPDTEGTVAPLTPARYCALREELLAGTPHTQQPEKAAALQAAYCRLYGGDLIRIRVGDTAGLAAFDREGEVLTFRELLFPGGDPVRAAQAVLRTEGAASAEVRTPAFLHTDLGTVGEDNVLVPGGFTFPKTEVPPWWGFSMD